MLCIAHEEGGHFMLQKQTKKAISFVTAVALVCAGTAAPWGTNRAQAAKKATLTTKKITVNVGKTKKITVKGKVKKAKYTFKSNKKKIATVTQKGVVKAKKKGIGHTVKVYATAKDGSKKKAYCKVKIKK